VTVSRCCLITRSCTNSKNRSQSSLTSMLLGREGCVDPGINGAVQLRTDRTKCIHHDERSHLGVLTFVALLSSFLRCLSSTFAPVTMAGRGRSFAVLPRLTSFGHFLIGRLGNSFAIEQNDEHIAVIFRSSGLLEPLVGKSTESQSRFLDDLSRWNVGEKQLCGTLRCRKAERSG